ncbi:hypothetical protein LSAT2_009922, partial [Lamellibrachia satsuma]
MPWTRTGRERRLVEDENGPRTRTGRERGRAEDEDGPRTKTCRERGRTEDEDEDGHDISSGLCGAPGGRRSAFLNALQNFSSALSFHSRRIAVSQFDVAATSRANQEEVVTDVPATSVDQRKHNRRHMVAAVDKVTTKSRCVRYSTYLDCGSAVSPYAYIMAAAVTSFLLLVLAMFGGHILGAASPRLRCPLKCECNGSYAHVLVLCTKSYLTDIPQLPVGTWKVLIKGNNITRLRASAFSELHMLRDMRIYKNNILSINERTFDGLASLYALYLDEEHLSSFENGVFRFFTNLTTLSMRVKGIDIPQGEICLLKHLRTLKLALFQFPSARFHPCFAELTELRMLSLSFVEQSNISRATFHPFRSFLTTLCLIHCRLRGLHVDMFKDLSKLTALDLSRNAITSLPSNIFAPLTHLARLNIAGNKLKVISGELLRPLRYLGQLKIGFNSRLNVTLGEEFLNMTRLELFVLSGIKLSSLNNKSFRNLRHSPLVKVDMSTCSLKTISNGALCPLRNLIVLSLDFNPLNGTVLHDAFYGLHGTPLREVQLTNVNLRDLSQPLFEGMAENNITTLYLRNSFITTIKRGVFRNLGKLNKLVLSASKITTIEDHSFEDLFSLSNLNLDNNNIVELPSAKRLGITPGLLLLRMSYNSIKEINQESLLGYDNLTALLLGDNNIRTISANAFAPTPRLKIDNPSLFQRLHRLTYLDISQNYYFGRLSASLRSVLQNLPSLDLINLHACGIEELPVSMFTNTTRLTECCSQWQRHQVVEPGCVCTAASSEPTYSGAKQDRVCECRLVRAADVTAPARPIAEPVCVQLRLDVVLGCRRLCLVAGRWYINYYFFLVRSRRRHYLELADGNYAYDAFVAHSSSDRVWVVRRLLPRLEAEGRYRLCLHQRDWLAGREISENIVESIEASRKVIIVLSNSFAQSRWCQVELAMASNRRLSNWRNSLVLVLLETISPENQTATLRCLLTTHTYLEWNER